MIKKLFKYLATLSPLVSWRVFFLRAAGYEIGEYVYIPKSMVISDMKSRKKNVIIGDRVMMGSGVTIITDSSPGNGRFPVSSKLSKIFPLVSENVMIKDDVWIGANVTILPGVTIGECAVIASGAVVNASVAPYTIVGGVPAKKIRNIDPDEL